MYQRGHAKLNFSIHVCMVLSLALLESSAAAQQKRPSPSTAQSSAGRGSLQLSSNHTDIIAWIVQATEYLKAQGQLPNEACQRLYGLPFVQEWQSRREAFCTSGTSTLTAYLGMGANKKAAVLESLNVVLDSAAFATNFGTGGMPQPQAGSLKAKCALNSKSKTMTQYTQLEITRRVVQCALQAGTDTPAAAAVATACEGGSGGIGGNSSSIVEHPVLLLQRYDTTNAYHNMEDVITVFVTLAVANAAAVKQQGIEVAIADDKQPGYFLEIWRRLAQPHKLRFLKHEPYPPGTCFRHMLHNPYAEPSLLSYAGVGQPNTCRSAVLIGLSRWLRALFPDIVSLWPAAMVEMQNMRMTRRITTKTILWITRRNFESMFSKHWTGWPRVRMYSNENDLLLALQRTVLAWNDEACFRKGRTRRLLQQQQQGNCRDKMTVYELQTIELSDVPFYPDQLIKLTRTSILAAAHGAGLANMVWMEPGRGAVLEVQHGSSGNYHYHNMAYWLGHKYTSVGSAGTSVNMEQVARALQRLMDEVS